MGKKLHKKKLKNFVRKSRGCKIGRIPIQTSVSFVLKIIEKSSFNLVDTLVPVWTVPRLYLVRVTPEDIVHCVEAEFKDLKKSTFEVASLHFMNQVIVKHNFWEYEVAKIDFVVPAIFVLMAPIVFQPKFPWSPR